MGIDQKVAVITGASQGIGAALVRAYRDRNYSVVATARSIRPSADDGVLAVPGDIADRRTAERAISEGVARFGRIDTLINNAGIFIAKPFAEYTEADYAAILGVNVAGFFHMTQLAVAEMEKHENAAFSAALRRLSQTTESTMTDWLRKQDTNHRSQRDATPSERRSRSPRSAGGAGVQGVSRSTSGEPRPAVADQGVGVLDGHLDDAVLSDADVSA
jgi:NAD(P)-dependent dehydrogenase (short-subunit alcohol dehydrogenase family)